MNYLLLSTRIKLLAALLLLGAGAGAVSVLSYHVIELTGEPEYCASCHEMEQFFDAWQAGPHGSESMGTRKAGCTGCHLPHDGTLNYIITKTRTGMHDLWAHYTGVETDWPAHLEKRNHYTYDSGCRRCHIELTAPGIPLKAINAHRDYRLGDTEKTCVDCHNVTGHGDLALMFMEETEVAQKEEMDDKEN